MPTGKGQARSIQFGANKESLVLWLKGPLERDCSTHSVQKIKCNQIYLIWFQQWERRERVSYSHQSWIFGSADPLQILGNPRNFSPNTSHYFVSQHLPETEAHEGLCSNNQHFAVSTSICKVTCPIGSIITV